ncbi:tautomerase family protein [Methylomonas rosea]|uniref:Tautomerase family protein n=1 Tax=Methylomonas rosea TaxID=2952227 RepID=A0ABT1TVH7_9GAMM|nr:tautomerase family protein [Methylomonas sp. WSC-7]MCQ8118761.1 tautomerase family protein [Methylomonas sp. WSC-7]
MKHEKKEFGRKIGEIVHQEMVQTISVPENDYFQVITEYDNNFLIYDSNYLGIHRSDGIIFIQITLNEGRDVDLKKLLYKNIADHLHNELDVRREDVLINLVEVKKENWSFGNGIAQYA